MAAIYACLLMGGLAWLIAVGGLVAAFGRGWRLTLWLAKSG